MHEDERREKADRETWKATEKTTAELEEAVKNRVAAGNELAVVALRKLVKWAPECGFPKNIRPAYCDIEDGGFEGNDNDHVKDYREEQGLNDPEMPFCTEAYTYELWGKEDARSFLAYLGAVARALGLEGLHDRRLR